MGWLNCGWNRGSNSVTGDLTVTGEITATDLTLTNLLSKASLATDLNGKIIEGSGSSATPALINSYFFEASTSKFFIPLAGSIVTSVSKTNERTLVPSNSGQLLKIRMIFDLPMGSTVFTLENSSSILGTKTQNIVAGLTEIDFTTGLDSGVNTFNGTSVLAVSFNPTLGPDNACVSTLWEFDN